MPGVMFSGWCCLNCQSNMHSMVDLVSSPKCGQDRCLALHADRAGRSALCAPASCSKVSVAATDVGKGKTDCRFWLPDDRKIASQDHRQCEIPKGSHGCRVQRGQCADGGAAAVR